METVLAVIASIIIAVIMVHFISKYFGDVDEGN
jgi:hypothetical protein